MPRKYITTAIDYPNAAPHMGHNARKANLAVFLPRAILSLFGALTAGARETRLFARFI